MSEVADWLPDVREVVAKDLDIANKAISGNPFVRYDTETEQRKYTSEGMWDQVDDKYVIPEGREIPRPLIVCQVCDQDSWRTNDDSCGLCGAPIFDCPADECGEEVHGQPDECPHCGAGYKWGDEETEDDS